MSTFLNAERNSGSTPTGGLTYDSFAQSYADQVTRLTMLHAKDLIGMVEPQIRQAKRILEIGCGAGAFGLAYHDYFPEGIAGQSILCTDLSPDMVNVARRVTEASSNNRGSQTEFVYQVADATKLCELDDQSFDMVISVFGIFLIPDRASTLREVRRVLQAGGALATTSWTTTSYNDELKANGFGSNLHDAMSVMKVLPKGTAAEDRKPNLLPQFVLDWFDRDKIREMLKEQSYFTDVTIRRAIHTTTFANSEHMWMAFTKSSPHGAALADQDPEQVELAKKALAAFLAPSQDDGAFIFSVSNLILAV